VHGMLFAVQGLQMGKAVEYFASAWAWKQLARCSLVLFALACTALTFTGCIPGVVDGDDCPWDEERCLGEHTKQHCYDNHLGTNAWASTECDAEHPYCVQVLDSATSPSSGRSSAECLTEPHCSASSECAYRGLCADGPNGCLMTGKDCASRPRCKSVGLCADGELECSATAEGCASSDACKSYGACALIEGHCGATAEGCASSDVCKSSGKCALIEGQCGVTAEGCAKSTECKTSGACSLPVPTTQSSLGQSCRATDEGCANSTECAERGFCRLIGGYCIQ